MGADAALGHGGVGAAAGVAHGDGRHFAQLQLASAQKVAFLRCPAPRVLQLLGHYAGHLPQLHGNAADAREVLFGGHLF